MQHGVRRMFADTTAPHLIALPGNTIMHHQLLLDKSSHKLDNYVEKANVTSTSPFLTLTSLLDDRSQPMHTVEREKRKLTTPFGDCEDDDDDEWTTDIVDDGDDDFKTSRTDTDGKSNSSGNRPTNHSEIEKRRRDKMNNFITEIAKMVPSCAGLSRRMDKLSVLRLAVQHIKTLRGSFNFNGLESYKPAYVSDEEFRELIWQNSDAFMIAVNCDDMRIFYASDNAEELVSQNFLCLVHPDDLDTVRSQVFWRAQGDRQQTHLAKDGKNNLDFGSGEWSTLAPGSKRSFYCRMKSRNELGSSPSFGGLATDPKLELDDQSRPVCFPLFQNPRDHEYKPVHCDGFIKFCSPTSPCSPTLSESRQLGRDSKERPLDGVTNAIQSKNDHNCLLLMVKPAKTIRFSETGMATGVTTPIRFTLRLSPSGRFLQADGSLTAILGYLPQELTRNSYYEYVHRDDIPLVKNTHQKACENGPGPIACPRSYRFRSKTGAFVQATANWSSFRNPWTGDMQFLVVEHSVVPEERRSQDEYPQANKLTTLTQLLLRKDSDTIPT